MEGPFLRRPGAEPCTSYEGAATVASAGPLLLAFATSSTYRRAVPIFRAFAVICFLLGLFVQGAAQASAMPQMPPAEMTDCAEMARDMPRQISSEKQSDQDGPCGDMSLDCLVAMGCLAPIALPGAFVANPAPPIGGAAFTPGRQGRLEGRPMRPESPPPQTLLTV